MTDLLPGAALFVISYSFYMWLRYHKPHYLFFSAYVICLVLFSITQGPVNEQAIDKQLSWPGPRLDALLSSLSAASGAVFCLALLSNYRSIPAVTRVLKTLAAINLLLAVASAFVFPGTTGSIFFFAASLSTLVCLSLSVFAAIRYRINLVCLCAGWSVIAVCLLAHALTSVDVWPHNAISHRGLPLAISLGLLLMTLALCEQLYAESARVLRQQLEVTRTLESSHNELGLNYRELQQQNQYLEQLLRKADRFDGITGLLNISAFHLELEREYKTALRHGNIVTVLALEISDLEQVYEDGGRSAGDSYLGELAQAVSAALQRPGDITGRIAGNRLGIVLPYTDIDGSLAVIQRVKQCIYQWKRNIRPTSGPIKLRAGIASTENSLARHADDLIESATAQLRELEQ